MNKEKINNEVQTIKCRHYGKETIGCPGSLLYLTSELEEILSIILSITLLVFLQKIYIMASKYTHFVEGHLSLNDFLIEIIRFIFFFYESGRPSAAAPATE